MAGYSVVLMVDYLVDVMAAQWVVMRVVMKESEWVDWLVDEMGDEMAERKAYD